MIRIQRVNNENLDFQELVRLLDAELAERDGAEHAFYAQFNGIETLDKVILLFEGEQAVACGAFKPFDAQSIEIKSINTKESKTLPPTLA